MVDGFKCIIYKNVKVNIINTLHFLNIPYIYNAVHLYQIKNEHLKSITFFPFLKYI